MMIKNNLNWTNRGHNNATTRWPNWLQCHPVLEEELQMKMPPEQVRTSVETEIRSNSKYDDQRRILNLDLTRIKAVVL